MHKRIDTLVRASCNNPWKSVRLVKIMDSISGHLSIARPLRILDLSTGMGAIPLMMRRRATHHIIIACDISVKDEVKSRFEKENIQLVEGVKFQPGLSLPFESCLFDAVVFTDCLEHIIDDPQHVFSEIHRIMKDGGLLVTTTPNFAHIVSRMKCLLGKQTQVFLAGGEHFRMYTMDELLYILRKGFVIRDASFINTVESWRFKGFLKLVYYFYLAVVTLKSSFRAGILISAEKVHSQRCVSTE